MFGILVAVFSFILLISASGAEVVNVDSRICVDKGQFCSGRGVYRCCGGLICDKDGPRSGKCVKCLGSGKRCFRVRTCCSKKCSWFTCE
ncbi:hypothetical protein AAHC03_04420 [Spirometra sp. Aus1]